MRQHLSPSACVLQHPQADGGPLGLNQEALQLDGYPLCGDLSKRHAAADMYEGRRGSEVQGGGKAGHTNHSERIVCKSGWVSRAQPPKSEIVDAAGGVDHFPRERVGCDRIDGEITSATGRVQSHVGVPADFSASSLFALNRTAGERDVDRIHTGSHLEHTEAATDGGDRRNTREDDLQALRRQSMDLKVNVFALAPKQRVSNRTADDPSASPACAHRFREPPCEGRQLNRWAGGRVAGHGSLSYGEDSLGGSRQIGSSCPRVGRVPEVNMLITALLSAARTTLPAVAAPALPSVDLGEPVPLFLLPAINEDAAVRAVARTQVELADLVGVSPRMPAKAVVLYFFDRNHGGDAIGELGKVHKQMQGKGVQVLAISADTGELGPLASWLDKQKVQVPVLRDEYGVVRSRYGITDASLPLTLVVESSGRLFAVGQPGPAELEASVAAEVSPLIK